jgi:dihydrofolate reductase
MTASYTFDVFSSLDGFGAASGNWTGYWGKQGPDLLDHRLALYDQEQRMVFGANTYRAFAQMLAASTEESDVRDPWVTRMRNLPATVVSTTLEGPLDWPDATVVSGDAVDVVARLKEESEVPLRSHGSLSMNRALMAAGLVDRVQATLFPVITGQTGLNPIFQGAADFDLELIESRTLDGRTQELIYRPTLHVLVHQTGPEAEPSAVAAARATIAWTWAAAIICVGSKTGPRGQRPCPRRARSRVRTGARVPRKCPGRPVNSLPPQVRNL